MSNVQFPYYPFNFRNPTKDNNLPSTWLYWTDFNSDYLSPTNTDVADTVSSEKTKQSVWKLTDNKDKYFVEFECPGSTKEDVTAELKDFALTLAATYKGKTKTKTVELPWDADEREVGITVKNGILRVEVKLHEDTKPKSIPIK